MRFVSSLHCLYVAAFAFVASAATSHAQTRIVQVETRDGRVLHGEVDERSDGNRLWIRRSEGNIILATSVAWNDIGGAALDGEQIELAALESDYKGIATAAPAAFLTEYEPLPLSTDATPIPTWHKRSRITSIEVDAGIVNLDRTVETDGLLVSLAVLDDHGAAVPVRGSFIARLIVERLDQHTGEVSFEEFQRWSAPVSPKDFHDGVAELPLRYRRLSPEFRWDLCTAALLNVRLSVAGQGNFEASAPVAIQEFNPIRDEMRNQQGSRFYRNELTCNTLQDGPIQLHRGYSAPRRHGF